MISATVRFLLIASLALLSCTRQDKPFSGAFLPEGNLQVEVTDAVKEVQVFDSKRNLVAVNQVFDKTTVELPFAWIEREKYTICFDGKQAGIVMAPSSRPGYRIRFHAPVGQKTFDYYLTGKQTSLPDTTISIAMSAGESADLIFEIEKLADTAAGRVKLNAEPISSDVGPVSLRPSSIEDSATLGFEFDKRLWSMQASVKETLKEKRSACMVSIAADGWQRRFLIEFAPRRVGTDSIHVVKWNLPTGAEGLASPKQSPGTILMPNVLWAKIGSLFGVKVETIDFFRPFVFQTADIVNDGNEPVGLMLTGEVIDLVSGSESPFFKAPDNQFTGGTDKIVSFVTIQPGQSETCVLPVYVAHNTPAGLFKSRITIQRLGSNHVLKVLENPVTVVKGNTVFSIWTFGIVVLSLGWLVLTILLYRRIVDSLGLRILVLLSLLGSLQFCLSFAGRLVSSVTYAILGPFNCLVGGLLTEVLTYLLITSILFLVPRVGAMTLAGIVNYIMGGILFGSFGFTDILYHGSGIAFREILLLVFGITHFRQSDREPAIFPMMLALGIAGAASTFTSLTLNSVFYRLYFADWYILLNVVVTGFFYTAIGVYLGKKLGRNLRKVNL